MTPSEHPAQAGAAGDGLRASSTATDVTEPDDSVDRLIGRGLGSRLPKLLSASTLTLLLGAAAYQYHAGFRQGVADRLGIAVGFVPSSSDPAATSAEMVILGLLVLFLIGMLLSLVPAFTGWPIFGLASLYELLRTVTAALRHERTASWLFPLVAALVYLGLAIAVELVARRIERLLKHRRRRERRLRWLRRLIGRLPSRLSPQMDSVVTIGGVLLWAAIALWLALSAAGQFGHWLGRSTATPDQAVIAGGHTYAWLGTTADGLVVVRSADFCGSQPEDARQVIIAGKRSQLIKAEGVEVIRLSTRLRLVDRCH
jgi:hypothetical protein